MGEIENVYMGKTMGTLEIEREAEKEGERGGESEGER